MHVPGTSDSGPREAVFTHLVSGNYFEVLGVPASSGRVLQDSDDTAAAVRVAVISYRFWQNRFNRQPGLIGKALILNGTAFTVVGVSAPEFYGERTEYPPDLFIPLSRQPEILPGKAMVSARNVYWLNMLGRLKPGVSMQSAQTAINLQFQQFYLQQAGSKVTASIRRQIAQARIVLKPGGGGISGLRFRYSQPLHLLMAVVFAVLVIACANIATLLLARASVRQPEFLARLALGASRGRLIRQLLTESLLLASISAVAGALFAWWSVKLLVVWMHVNPVVSLRPNAVVLAFTLSVSVLTGLAFGLLPAIRASSLDLRPGPVSSNKHVSSASVLIVLQISLSLVLLLSSGLLAHSLLVIVRQDLGYQKDHILLVKTDLQLAEYRNQDLFPLYRDLDEHMNAIPGVISAAVARFSPISGNSSSRNFTFEGSNPPHWQDLRVYTVEVGPHFFETLKTSILLGRGIGTRDTAAAPSAIVVNETFVNRYLHGRNPIGVKLSLGNPYSAPGSEIVGVARDSKYYDLREDPQPMAFYSLWQPRRGEYTIAHEILLRTSADAASVVPEVRRTFGKISSKLPILEVSTLNEQINHSMEQQRLIAFLCTALGIMALLLASIGIYGTVAYSVARRTPEIGIRMAIGARPGNILWMVLGDIAALLLAGIALGLPLSSLAARWIKSFLFGVAPEDPAAIFIAILLITLLGSLAAFLPARRAASIEPISALKYE